MIVFCLLMRTLNGLSCNSQCKLQKSWSIALCWGEIAFERQRWIVHHQNTNNEKPLTPNKNRKGWICIVLWIQRIHKYTCKMKFTIQGDASPTHITRFWSFELLFDCASWTICEGCLKWDHVWELKSQKVFFVFTLHTFWNHSSSTLEVDGFFSICHLLFQIQNNGAMLHKSQCFLWWERADFAFFALPHWSFLWTHDIMNWSFDEIPNLCFCTTLCKVDHAVQSHIGKSVFAGTMCMDHCFSPGCLGRKFDTCPIVKKVTQKSWNFCSELCKCTVFYGPRLMCLQLSGFL